MTAWIVILAIGAATYVLRVSMFVALGGRTLPAWLVFNTCFMPPSITQRVSGPPFSARRVGTTTSCSRR